MSYTKTASVAANDKHNTDVPVLLFKNGKLFSGGNDGKIKVWNSDLKLEKTIDAHPVNVYDLAANDKYLYSCSNDCTLKVWDLGTLEFVKNIDRKLETEVLKLYFNEGKLYSGDNVGNVLVLHNDDVVGQYGTLEEITGLGAKNNYLFTAGQLDFTVTEMKPGNITQFATRKCEPGHGPISMINDRVYFVNRDGRSISILNANPSFEILGKLEGHEMMLNAVCGDESLNVLYTGGYDKAVKCWDINTSKSTASLQTENYINAIATGNKQVFISSGSGDIEKFVAI